MASELWPTVGRVIDHLGSVQRWATEIVRSGTAQDRSAMKRPADRARLEWFREGAAGLLAELAAARPQSPVLCALPGIGSVGFWHRRMAHEAAKHLWDLRTARDAAPPFPDEVGVDGCCDVIEEFGDVFMAQARTRGIEPLPAPLALISSDTDRCWRITPDWHLEADAAGPVAGAASVGPAMGEASDPATVGDLALMIWLRADPFAGPDRFRDRRRPPRGARVPAHPRASVSDSGADGAPVRIPRARAARARARPGCSAD
ncbi:maleylpyruvate isomerase N-terminal domain-containing protein [Streptomyces sp. ISL-90]|nr:maleylpyruvate isomerase N-terminal domain-containing protein [Streptomyces sp. ISL-90]